jgi:hypothetical protein
MLAGWIMDGGVCGKNFKGWMHEIAVKKTSGVFEDWLSQTEAVTKYGEIQLKAMVEAGTIQVRRLPSDQRFFEFRALTQKSSTVVEGTKKTITEGEKKAINRDEMIAFSKIDAFAVAAQDFELDDYDAGLGKNSSGSKDCIQDDLAKALKIKTSAAPKGKGVKGKTDPLEVLSQILPGDGKEEIKKKLVTFKSQLLQEAGNIEKTALDLKASKHVKDSNQAMKTYEVLEKLGSKMAALIKQGNPKKEDQKKLLLESYKEISNAKKLKSGWKKLLPKEDKKSKNKAKADDEQEEDDEEEAEDAV